MIVDKRRIVDGSTFSKLDNEEEASNSPVPICLQFRTEQQLESNFQIDCLPAAHPEFPIPSTPQMAPDDQRYLAARRRILRKNHESF